MSEKDSGSKYVRAIRDRYDRTKTVQADVYDVLEAFGDPIEPVAHAIKKLLCGGLRGKGSRVQDYTEAIDAIRRAIARESDTPPQESVTLPSISVPVPGGNIIIPLGGGGDGTGIASVLRKLGDDGGAKIVSNALFPPLPDPIPEHEDFRTYE